MSFRSASYAVVARIFKLIDNNGFTRMLFGPKSFGAPINHDGYAFEYDEPSWSGDSRETGVAFGEHTVTAGSAETFLYARDPQDDFLGQVLVRGYDTGSPGARGTFATLNTTGLAGIRRAEVATTVLEDNISGVHQAAASLAAVAGFATEAFVSAQAVESQPSTLELWGEEISVRSPIAPEATDFAGDSAGRMYGIQSASGAQVGAQVLGVVATTVINLNFTAERDGFAILFGVGHFSASVAGYGLGVLGLSVNGVTQAGEGVFNTSTEVGTAMTVPQTWIVPLVANTAYTFSLTVRKTLAGGTAQTSGTNTTLRALYFT